MTDRIPVEELGYGVLDIQSIETDWNPENYLDDDWEYWEAFEYELGERTFVLIASRSSVIAAFDSDGRRIDLDDTTPPECQECDGTGAVLKVPPGDDTGDVEETPCPACAGTGNELRLTQEELWELERVEPYRHGSEGPMMNYRYPLPGDDETSVGGYFHSTDAIGAAYRLRDVPLCVVYYQGMALALTGGGMDLSWEIVEAFTLLGYLPPVQFSLPKMAGVGEHEHEKYLIAAVERSLACAVERSQFALDSHREAWGLTS